MAVQYGVGLLSVWRSIGDSSYHPDLNEIFLICLASLSTEKNSALADLTAPNHSLLARRSGFSYIHHRGKIDQSRHPAWSKLLLVARLLPAYEAVLWVDTDVVILRPIDEIVEWMLEREITLFKQPRGDKGPNTGIVCFKNHPDTFRALGAIYFEFPMAWDSMWWDQEAFKQFIWRQTGEVVSLLPDDIVNFEGGPVYENAAFYHAYGPVDKIEKVKLVLAKLESRG